MLTKCCYCCNLRAGCILCSWLQLMLIVLIITGLASPLVLLDWNYISRNNYAAWQPILSIIIAMQVIKSVTCICLTWALTKRNYIFYQPWLLVQGIENVILSVGFMVIFCLGFGYTVLFSFLIPVGAGAGLYWYCWACVYATYKQDKMLPSQHTNELYDTPLVP